MMHDDSSVEFFREAYVPVKRMEQTTTRRRGVRLRSRSVNELERKRVKLNDAKEEQDRQNDGT
jgi:hypothetical protein